MYKAFLLPLLFLFPVVALVAQHSFFEEAEPDKPWAFEIQLGGGLANCLTDLGGGPGAARNSFLDTEFQNFRLSGSISIGITSKRGAGLRLEHLRTQLTAADADIGNATGQGIHRLKRNLHFRTPVSETALLAEIYPLVLAKKLLTMISPYFVAGFGLLKFEPQAELLGNWIPLHPLRTEGQGFKQHPERKQYSLHQPVIPLGGGFRYDASPVFNFRVEFRYRVLFTDYLDDVSSTYIHPGNFYQNLNPVQAAQATQLADRRIGVLSGISGIEGSKRGNPEKKDAYFGIEVRLGILLNRIKRSE